MILYLWASYHFEVLKQMRSFRRVMKLRLMYQLTSLHTMERHATLCSSDQNVLPWALDGKAVLIFLPCCLGKPDLVQWYACASIWRRISQSHLHRPVSLTIKFRRCMCAATLPNCASR